MRGLTLSLRVKKYLAKLTFLAVLFSAGAVQAADWAVVLMYHRFGETEYPSTNIRLDQFEAHIKTLKEMGVSVLPLGEVVDALKTGKELPDKTVAITVDDGYLSVYKEAWPRLKAAGFPFTIFASTNQLSGGQGGYMNWSQLKEMVDDGGVYVGHHGSSHAHLPKLTLDQVRDDILKANATFKEKLGFVPAIFAYPYGEYGSDLKNLIADLGFKAAFGQHSGVSYSGWDEFEYPRFPLNENYGNIGRLKLAAQAMPLRVRNVLPSDNILSANPPNFGFTVDENYKNIHQLNCYSGNRISSLQQLGVNRIEVRLSQPYAPGRARINCTLPGPDGRYRWFGTLFYIPRT